MGKEENKSYRMAKDGFYGELVTPAEDKYPQKALICFSGSDGGIELAKTLADTFASHGLTTLALAYVLEEGLPDLINAVVAVAPMNTVCHGFVKDKGISFLKGSSWSLHGQEIPYSAYKVQKFPMGQILLKSIQRRDVSMYELYQPLLEDPDPEAVIRVEKITGPILLISSKMDVMWSSELAAGQILKRLKDHDFPYEYRHLSYDYGSHMFVPFDTPSTKFFRGDRGRYKELGHRDRMDSLEKTLDFVSRW